jgi:outer membrane protein assembly factor BamB
LGIVTIYAATDGFEGSAIVDVIPDALTDWTGAADWTTFQGNAAHTGFVPVTVDPAAFNERWIATFDGATLQPVAAAEGKIFVTTDSRLFVLDELTGAQNWLYDFGNAGAPGPPAYGDGAVFTATSGAPYLWGFDAGFGQIRFRALYESQGERYLAPVVIDKRVFFGGGQYGGMYSMSATNGAQQWFDTLAQNSGHTPAVRDSLVYAYVAGRDAAGLTVADTGSGTVAYRILDAGFTSGFPPAMNTAPALGALDDALVTQGGRLIAFDLVNHSVRWQRAGSFTGAVTIAGGTLYVYNGGAVEARQESDGALLWSWTLPDGAPSGTILATSNVVFFGSSSTTWAFDRATHTSVWSYPAGGQLALTRGGVLLIAQPTGVLAAIDLR